LTTRGNQEILTRLEQIVGQEYATNEDAHLQPYTWDLTWAEPRMPDYVVMPKTVTEIQRIVRLANHQKIPIIPYCNATNIGGLCVPEEGGIIMDLKRMDQIIKIDPETNYAVIEPGVSHGQFSAALKNANPQWEGHQFSEGFEFGWGVCPSSGSVLAMAINHGIGHLNGREGVNSQLLSSMEVVLPTGEVVKVGSAAYSDSWHSMMPLPRMDGLFTGWLGTTGIVTKLGVWIFPRRPYRDVLTLAAESAKDITKYMVHWRHYQLCDEVTAVSWWLAQIPIVFPYHEKPKDAPEFYSYTVVTGWTEEEIEYKRKMWKQVVADEKKRGTRLVDYEYPPEAKKGRTELPSRIVGSTKNYSKSCGGGLAWPGTFAPCKSWPILYEEWKKIYIRHGLSPATRFTDYQGAHYGMLRCMTPFNKRDPKSVQAARDAMVECVRAGIPLGMLPYKPPVEYQNELNAVADAGYIYLMAKIKDMLDPNNIMNPGKLGVR